MTGGNHSVDAGLDRGKKDGAVGAQGPGLEVIQDQEGTHEINLEASEGGTARGKGVGRIIGS